MLGSRVTEMNHTWFLHFRYNLSTGGGKCRDHPNQVWVGRGSFLEAVVPEPSVEH